MKKQTLILISGLLLVFAAAGQAAGQRVENPSFTQYAAKKMTGQAAAVDLKSHPQANEYRTRLKKAARGGVNFAGRYIIVTWGCGSRCSQGAVIDAKTGAVYFPEEFGGFSSPLGFLARSTKPVEFKPNSRLLILHGTSGEKDAHEGVYYFEWTGKEFRKIKFTASDPIVD